MKIDQKFIRYNKSIIYIVVSFLFIFPVLKENISSLLIILLTLSLLSYKIIKKEPFLFKKNFLVLTIPFWIVAITSIFSSNYPVSISHIQHSMLFLILPILFSNLPVELFDDKKINFYLTILKNTTLVIAFIYVVGFFYENPTWRFTAHYYNDSFFRNYVYNEFKLFIIHPTYYTNILILCCLHSFDLVIKQKKYLQLIYVFVYMLITFLLLTKLNIILMCSWLVFSIIFRTKFSVTSKFLTSIAFIIGFILLFIFTPGISRRFSEFKESINTKPKNLEYNSVNIRKAIFDTDITLIKENWLYGVGFENLQDKLNEKYKENYKSSFYENHNYLSHNYYFYIFISAGILGLLAYLLYLFYVLKIVIKTNYFLMYIVFSSMLMICFIEDYFYRHNGVLYFNLILLTFYNNARFRNKN